MRLDAVRGPSCRPAGCQCAVSVPQEKRSLALPPRRIVPGAMGAVDVQTLPATTEASTSLARQNHESSADVACPLASSARTLPSTGSRMSRQAHARFNSRQGESSRQWATRTLRDHPVRGHAVNEDRPSPPLVRFTGLDEIHRGEDAEAPGLSQGNCAKIEQARNLRRAARHDPQPFQQPKRAVGYPAPGG